MPILGRRCLLGFFYDCKLIKIDSELDEKPNELLGLCVREYVQSVTIALEQRADRSRAAWVWGKHERNLQGLLLYQSASVDWKSQCPD
jgi:hypothetical protein